MLLCSSWFKFSNSNIILHILESAIVYADQNCHVTIKIAF